MEDKILTIEEVCEYLKISRAFFYTLKDREVNPLPVIYLGKGSVRVSMIALNEWLKTDWKQGCEDSQEGC